jgi:2-polyprenyl-6-methoxyphenol hydroxylase-like FAD-dependent oxidoreductase
VSSGRASYDAIIVGARCAGSPLAARLAEGGWSVLLVDREPPPAETLSTHMLFPNTMARLHELGALKRIEAEHRLNPVQYGVRILGSETSGRFTPIDGFDRSYGITRPVLDKALLEVALAAGAETRFGQRVTGLLGAGGEEEPVRGVVLEDGEEVQARWVFGADGRASTVARLLGLEKERPLAGEMAFMYGYWQGLPERDHFFIDVIEEGSLAWMPCEDDLSILVLGLAPELTRGNQEQRERTFRAGAADFADWLDPTWLDAREQIGPIHLAPETMLRGFFRRPNGPGWALVGDACHFKNPSTAQGISDAIEQSLHVAAELLDGENLDGYEAWRDERAREHYEWSFDFARFPKPETSGPIFAGVAADPEAGRDLRDALSRRLRPRSDVFTPERLGRWFQAVST